MTGSATVIQLWVLVGGLAWAGCAGLPGDEQDPLGPDAAQATYQVRGVAMGVIEPVRVRLLATGVNEVRRVNGDGTFEFATEVVGADSYSVHLVDATTECVVTREPEMAPGEQVSLWCGMLDGLEVTGARASDLGFATAQPAYRTEVSALQDSITVTATAGRPDVAITIAGRAATSGEPSSPVPLGPGETVIAVTAHHEPSGAEVSYEVAIARSGVIAQEAYGKASNTGAEDWFGWSVALSGSGDTLAIGAFREDSLASGVDGDQTDNSASDSGAVYVFAKAGGTWSQQAYLKASNTDPDDWFGYSVALSDSGDTLVVGALFEASAATGINGDQTDDTSPRSGAVYVFTRTGSAWAQQAYLKASNTDSSDHFGYSVALSSDGDTLAVGAYTEASSGAVYVFTRSGSSTWTQEAYLKASNTGPSDYFGWSVALSDSGDTLAVGAPEEASQATGIGGNGGDNTASDSGAVYVFTRSGSTWAQQAYIKASNTDAYDYFGISVALSDSGDTLAVGASYEDSQATGIGGNQADNNAGDSGAVYVFTRSGSIWTQQAYLKASNTDSHDHLGRAVALSGSGDILVVSARHEDSQDTGVGGDQGDNTASESGAVYAFTRSGSTWVQAAYLKASNTDPDDYFGYDVALSESGDTLAVGAPYEASQATGIGGAQGDNTARDSGAVYIFH